MEKKHYQGRQGLTPVEMSDLETVVARTDVETFRRAIRYFVAVMVLGVGLIVEGGVLAETFGTHQVINGWVFSSAPNYAISMIWVGGAVGVMGVGGAVWFLWWAMKQNIWGRYRAVQHRLTQLQLKDTSG